MRGQWSNVGILLAAVSASAAESLPGDFPLRRGPLLLCRAADLARPNLPEAELAWLSRFGLIVTNGYELPHPKVAERLRSRGCRLFRYFWTNGFTQQELGFALPDGDWRQRLVGDRPDMLLAPEPLAGPAGTPNSYYFDFTSPDLPVFLSQRLMAVRRKGAYDGIFFDYAGVYALPEEAKRLWGRKHPGAAYDRVLARFLTHLREWDTDGLIFTNQACLSDEPLITCADWDLVESYGTSHMWGATATVRGKDVLLSYLRPWPGPGGLREMYAGLTARLEMARPRSRLLCLDYMRGVPAGGPDPRLEIDLEAVYYSYCAAALWGLDSFCSGWYGVEYRGPLYFADLGKPLGGGPREVKGVVVREYEHGLVVLMTRTSPATLAWTFVAPGAGGLYDLFSGTLVPCGKDVTLRAKPSRCPATGGSRPSARVYLKVPTVGN